MDRQKVVNLIGYASGIAANEAGCAKGPLVLQRSGMVEQLAALGVVSRWDSILSPQTSENKYLAVSEIATRLALKTRTLSLAHERFVVFGGDHTSAIGTWSGVANALRAKGDMGLIWIDAHLDSHTPETSETGNIHGMPLAVLLGHGHPSLIHIENDQAKLKPSHVCVIGARSYEKGEYALLNQLQVKIFTMDDIHRHGLKNVFTEAKNIVCHGTVGYGVSLDIDAIDPNHAPGVGVPEPHGLNADALIEALKNICEKDKMLLGEEIVEFNPEHDQAKKTERLIMQLVSAFYL